jgi:hypothetical protein
MERFVSLPEGVEVMSQTARLIAVAVALAPAAAVLAALQLPMSPEALVTVQASDGYEVVLAAQDSETKPEANELEGARAKPEPSNPDEEAVAPTLDERCADRAIQVHVAAMADIHDCGRPVRLTLGDLAITIAGRPDPADPDHLVPEFTIRRGNRPPSVVRPIPSAWGHAVTVGTLDGSGARYVMIQGFTGGLHCCVSVEVALPDGLVRGLIGIGYFEAGYEVPMDDPAPDDVDGDGHTDFIAHDNRFFYEFDGFAGTHPPPPQVWNIRGDRAVNVSAEPRYRDLYVQPAAEARFMCLTAEPREADRSACASYAASAARLGDFDRAWREIRQVIPMKHGDMWGNPYLSHLRHFLALNFYLGEADRSEREVYAHTILFPGESLR